MNSISIIHGELILSEVYLEKSKYIDNDIKILKDGVIVSDFSTRICKLKYLHTTNGRKIYELVHK